MTKKKPIPGSLVKAHMVKRGEPYDLWAIVLSQSKNKKVNASVIEVVPEDYQKWTRKGIEPPPAGSAIALGEENIEIVIHPRRRLTKTASPQFVIKLNNGKISDIYATGDHPASVRLVDLAKHYCDEEARQDFHRDVLVTQKGVEALDGEDSV